MNTPACTEDDFKQVLKNLFAEKKKVKELQKQLEEKGFQKKIQAKLSDIHKFSLAEEFAKLKAAYLEKEQENTRLHGQIEKVRPALKKLLEDLKNAKTEVANLKVQTPVKEEKYKEILEEAHKRIKLLEEQNSILEQEKNQLAKENVEVSYLQKNIMQLEEERENLHKKNAVLEEAHRSFDIKIDSLTKILEDERSELARTRANEQKENQRFEGERARLVEKLADSLSQVQRQTEMIKDLGEELTETHKKIHELEQQERSAAREIQQLKGEISKTNLESHRTSKLAEYQLVAMKEEKENSHAKIRKLEEEITSGQALLVAKDQRLTELGAELDRTKEQLQGSDFAVLSNEYDAKLKEMRTQIDQLQNDKEEILEKGYVKMKELSERHGSMLQERELLQKKLEEQGKLFAKVESEQNELHITLKNVKLQCEERDAEIRKAQQHLAKKVKETTILRDLVERQKGQLLELQSQCDKQKSELERVQNSLNLQRMHEEKLQAMAKERTLAAENLTKEWQEKFLALQEDWQEKKGELIELQKMRKTYDQMATTFSSLKNILGNSIESAPAKETHYPGN